MKNRSKITIRTTGGLGNQLFGYFFGLTLATKLSCRVIFDSKLIHFGSNESRISSLQTFKQIYEHIEHKGHSSFATFFLGSFKSARKVYWKLLNFSTVKYEDHKVSKFNFKFKENLTYSGYFQNWFYADRFLQQNPNFHLEIENPSKRYIAELELINEKNPICIHLREGDYLKFKKIYRLIPVQYFEFCRDLEMSKDNNREVWIFTENSAELEYYTGSIFEKSSRVIDKKSGISDVESFMLMTQSKTLIATNSTYSLWAAWFVWKNGHTAYVPLQSFIAGVSDELMDERWNRYDFEKDVFYPGKFNQQKYEKLEREFLSKFA